MTRPNWDQHFVTIAMEVAKMGTCSRRQVGCVLVDERHVMLATGFNGAPPGWGHCNEAVEYECPGAHAASGTNLDACVANHAEINALLHCSDVMRAHVCYTTTSPCISCIKALLCTGVARVIFLEAYPHIESRELWTRFGTPRRPIDGYSFNRTWEQFNVLTGRADVSDSSEFRK